MPRFSKCFPTEIILLVLLRTALKRDLLRGKDAAEEIKVVWEKSLLSRLLTMMELYFLLVTAAARRDNVFKHVFPFISHRSRPPLSLRGRRRKHEMSLIYHGTIMRYFEYRFLICFYGIRALLLHND